MVRERWFLPLTQVCLQLRWDKEAFHTDLETQPPPSPQEPTRRSQHQLSDINLSMPSTPSVPAQGRGKDEAERGLVPKRNTTKKCLLALLLMLHQNVWIYVKIEFKNNISVHYAINIIVTNIIQIILI